MPTSRSPAAAPVTNAATAHQSLNAGPGYGGSRFPEDRPLLSQTANVAGVPQRPVETVCNVDESRKRTMTRKVLQAAGGSLGGETIRVLGITFKRNTDDMRVSPSFLVVRAPQAERADVQARDPGKVPNAGAVFARVAWGEGARATFQDRDLTLSPMDWTRSRVLDRARTRIDARGRLRGSA